MIRVLIVDDHPIVREGVAAVLERERDLDVVGAAGSVEDGVRLAVRAKPHVVLLDLRLSDQDGIDGVAAFTDRDIGVVMFTAYDAEDDVQRALRAGARGYLLKGAPAGEIAQAIREVHAGHSYLSPRVAGAVVRGVTHPRGQGALSARERAVLQAVAAGQSNRAIAAALGIAERTVKFHVTALFNKLGAENRAQAVAIAAARGLLPRP